MKMAARFGWMAIVVLFACQRSEGPAGPEAVARGPASELAACPCWDGGMVAVAFPAAHFYLDQGDMAALTRFDNANAQQIQALVRLAVGAAASGSCELATYGAGGIVESLMSADGLTGEQCATCAALLRGPAVTFGLVAAAPEGGSVEP